MGAATSLYMQEGFFTGGPYTYFKYGMKDMLMNCFDGKETHIREDAEEIMRGEGFFPVAFDARFPNQRDTKRCYQNFIDYHRCINAKGEDFEPCNYFKASYTQMCKSSDLDDWEEQLENEVFPGMYQILGARPDGHHGADDH